MDAAYKPQNMLNTEYVKECKAKENVRGHSDVSDEGYKS